jgi:SPP1 family phage portal protein
MQLVPPKAADGKEGTVKAEYLTKSYDVSGVEAYKTRLDKDIHTFTNTPDMADENFSGNTSGEAMKYKLFGLDQDRIETQSQFTKGLKRRYRLASRVGELVKEFKAFDENLLENNIHTKFAEIIIRASIYFDWPWWSSVTRNCS